MLKLNKWSGYINSNQSETINNVNGFVYVRCSYSYGGYILYYATFGDVKEVANTAGYGITVKLTHNKDNSLIIKNTAEGTRLIEIQYQYLQ